MTTGYDMNVPLVHPAELLAKERDRQLVAAPLYDGLQQPLDVILDRTASHTVQNRPESSTIRDYSTLDRAIAEMSRLPSEYLVIAQARTEKSLGMNPNGASMGYGQPFSSYGSQN